MALNKISKNMIDPELIQEIENTKTQLAEKLNYRQTSLPGSETVNMIAGFKGNAVAEDLKGATIVGGGELNSENVIGGTVANVGTSIPNNNPMVLGTDARYAVIGGGYDNVNNALAGVLTGFHCFIDKPATHGTISGGSFHKIQAGNYTTISGGTLNTITAGDWATIGGGIKNVVSNNSATIAGGTNNKASGNASAIGGGGNNVASGPNSTIAGGVSNVASGDSSIAEGGFDNQATAEYTTAIGGANNRAAANYATVLGGRYNEARSLNTVAQGLSAVARTPGQHAHAYGMFTVAGDAQNSKFALKNQSTSASATVIGLNGASHPQMPHDASWGFKYTIVARRADVEGETKMWTIEGLVQNNTGVNAQIIGTPTKIVIGNSAGAETWDVTIATGSDSLYIQGIGEVGKTINWVAKLETVEVIA